MQPIDIAIVVVFLLGNILLGLFQGKSNKNNSDYFLGGHRLPWLVAMLSIVATETSVLTFVSVPGLAYRGDWTFLQLPLGYILGRILVSFILLPAYFEKGVSSIYEIIGTRFGKGMQRFASVVFLLTRILGDGIRFLATGVVVQVVTGWSLPFAVTVIGIVTLIYTISGGLKTVVWLDSIQFGLYLLGGVASIVFILLQLDADPLSVMQSLAASGKLSMIDTEGNVLFKPMVFGSAFAGGIFLSFASHGIDYMMVQRVLGCSDLGAARKAMIGSGLFVFFQFMVFLLAGSLMYLFMQGMATEKDREFATFIVSYLPSGLKGLLLAGILSAAMSTIASSINSLAASTVTDLLGGKVSLFTSKAISAGWAFVLISIALLFDESDKAIIMVGLEIASFTYGGLLGLFLLSKSKRRFRQMSLAIALLASMGIVFVLKLYGIAWTWYIVISSAINIIIAYMSDSLFDLLDPEKSISGEKK